MTGLVLVAQQGSLGGPTRDKSLSAEDSGCIRLCTTKLRHISGHEEPRRPRCPRRPPRVVRRQCCSDARRERHANMLHGRKLVAS